MVVALKVLFPSPKILERELAGLIRCRDCRHPNLIRIWHVERTVDAFYYTMDLADDLNAGCGEYLPDTLENRLERQKRLPSAEVAKLAGAIEGALKALHAKGLIHRDVKPGNILWINGVPTLGDAGLTASARENSLVGTPEFMPEEVLRKKRAATPEDDFYALRLVLYCAFTGETPGAYPHCPPGLLTERDSALWRHILGETKTAVSPAPRGRRLTWHWAITGLLIAFTAFFAVFLTRQTTARRPKNASDITVPVNTKELLKGFQADNAEYEKVGEAAKRHYRMFYANLNAAQNRLLFQREFEHLNDAEYMDQYDELRKRAAAGKERDVLLRLYECQDRLNRMMAWGANEGLPPLLKQRHELLGQLVGRPELAEVYGLEATNWNFFAALTTEAPAYHWGEATKNPKISKFYAKADRFSKFFQSLPGESIEELKSLLADRTVKLSDEEKLLSAICAIHDECIAQPDWERGDIRCDEPNIRFYAMRFRQNKYLFERLYREYPKYRP